MAVGSAGQPPFGGHAGRVWSIAFRPDGLTVATSGDDGTVRIWDAATGDQRTQLTGPPGPVYSVAYSPDGTAIAAGGDDGTVRIWDAGSGELRAQLTGHTGPVRSVAYSRDGVALATAGGDRTVRIWDATTGTLRVGLAGHVGQVNAVAFSPDGTVVATGGGDRSVRVWDVGTGAEQERFLGHNSTVNAVAFSPDGTAIVTAGGDRVVRVWDLGGGPGRTWLSGHSGTVNALAFSPDGTELATAGGDRTVRIWEFSSGRQLSPLQGHVGSVNSVAYRSAGTTAFVGSASNDGTAGVWEARTGVRRALLMGHTGLVNAVAYRPDGAVIATAGADRTTRIWDAGTGDQPLLLHGHTGPVRAVAYSPDGAAIVTVSEDTTGRIYDATSGTLLRLLDGHSNWVRSVAYSLDSSLIATASDDSTVIIWDARTGEQREQLTGHTGLVSSVAFSPDGTEVISGGQDGTVRAWDTATGEQRAELPGYLGEVWSVACRGGESGPAVAAAGSDGTVLIWDLSTHVPMAQLTGHVGPVNSMAYSPSEAMIATAGSDGTVRIWDTGTGTQLIQLTGHTSAVRSVAYNHDGTAIATCGYDGTIRIWDAKNGTQTSGTGFNAARSRRVALAGVRSDSPSKTDLIGVERDVETLAELIAATETSAPLAIALIGEWGAGKSSVMEQVQAEIERFADMSRNNPEATAFATSVRQIHFNAWHYSGNDLWAGVARHMFQTLSSPGGKDDSSGVVPDISSDRIGKERDQQRAALETYENERRQLESELDKLKGAKAPGGFLKALDSPTYLAWTYRYTFQEVRAEVRTRRATLIGWAVLLGLGISIWFFLSAKISAAIAAADLLTASLLPILTKIRLWHRLLTGTATDLTQKLELKKSEVESSIADTRERLKLADAQFRLSEFVRDRGNSPAYRDNRGLIGQVHEDLLLLRENLRQARVEWDRGDKRSDPPLERIVLYIDDLDRCSPRRVVEVLEAVHLILALDLFVVVVAVDARWMIRSLEHHHREFFGGASEMNATAGSIANPEERRIEPYDYLDKIFQIPYTLLPPDQSGSARYLRALLPEPRLAAGSRPSGSQERAVTIAAPRIAPDNRDEGEPRQTNGMPPGVTQQRQRTADPKPPGVTENSPAQSSIGPDGQRPGFRAVTDLQPPSLRLSHAEVEFMTRLGNLTPSPRAAKRMANLYRLLRISIPDEDIAYFLGDAHGGPYRVAQVVIAIMTGSPASAYMVFNSILVADRTDDLLEVLTLGTSGTGMDGQPFAVIRDRLERLISETGLPSQVAEYQWWCAELARYSFRTWQLARRPAGRQFGRLSPDITRA